MVDVFDESVAVLLEFDARGSVQGVDRETGSDRAIVADGISDLLEALPPESRSILERPAVLVGPLVRPGREELQRQVAVRTVDIDDVEARLTGPLGAVDVISLHAPDIVGVHVSRIDVRLELRRDLRRAARRVARLVARRVRTAVPQFD